MRSVSWFDYYFTVRMLTTSFTSSQVPPRLDAERNLVGMTICANTCACIGTTLRPKRSRFPPSHVRSSSFFLLSRYISFCFWISRPPYDLTTTSRRLLLFFSFLSPLILFLCSLIMRLFSIGSTVLGSIDVIFFRFRFRACVCRSLACPRVSTQIPKPPFASSRVSSSSQRLLSHHHHHLILITPHFVDPLYARLTCIAIVSNPLSLLFPPLSPCTLIASRNNCIMRSLLSSSCLGLYIVDILFSLFPGVYSSYHVLVCSVMHCLARFCIYTIPCPSVWNIWSWYM